MSSPSTASTLLNDGNFWDGWQASILIERQDWPALPRAVAQTGQPLAYYLYYAAAHIAPGAFIPLYRLIVLLSMLGIALSVMSLCERG